MTTDTVVKISDFVQSAGISMTAEYEAGVFELRHQLGCASELLQRVWLAEGGRTDNSPNFARIVKDSQNNIRESLMSLQRVILEVA